VRVRNQFGRAALRVRRPRTLCLPSFKQVIATPAAPASAPKGLDHFKCYEAERPNFTQRTVGLRDQFGDAQARVIKTRQLCNLVRKKAGKVVNPRAHLVCYETRDLGVVPFQQREVRVTNQFGLRQLSARKPASLCVPSLKRRGTAAPTGSNPTNVLDHFRCYDVKTQRTPKTVRLVDQFGRTTTKVVQVVRLCNPVRKNNEPVRRAQAHLVCYGIRDAQPFQPLSVRVRNQFGLASLRVRRPQTLCLPSFKQLT